MNAQHVTFIRSTHTVFSVRYLYSVSFTSLNSNIYFFNLGKFSQAFFVAMENKLGPRVSDDIHMYNWMSLYIMIIIIIIIIMIT